MERYLAYVKRPSFRDGAAVDYAPIDDAALHRTFHPDYDVRRAPVQCFGQERSYSERYDASYGNAFDASKRPFVDNRVRYGPVDSGYGPSYSENENVQNYANPDGSSFRPYQRQGPSGYVPQLNSFGYASHEAFDNNETNPSRFYDVSIQQDRAPTLEENSIQREKKLVQTSFAENPPSNRTPKENANDNVTKIPDKTPKTQKNNSNEDQMQKFVSDVHHELQLSTVAKFSPDKQKAINTSGMRVFTGSVERILKWHRTLSEMRVDYVFEVIGKCINIKAGAGCKKFLLLRDSSGPVIQIVYYAVDFALYEIKVDSVIRVIGRMISTNRMKAFKVREVMSHEQVAVSRLCAVSQHMITKLRIELN